MFEDSTFESNNRIHTRSRGWMLATFLFNGAILLGLILIPLIYPQALPHQAFPFLMIVPPPPPVVQPTPPPPTERVFHGAPQMQPGAFTAPRIIPPSIYMADRQEVLPPTNAAELADNTGVRGPGDVFRTRQPVAVTHATAEHVRIASTIATGMLLRKITPAYPPIAVSIRQEGTVVLHATISKAGTIENLQVVSGPPLLQQAALDAVARWVYRPYLLNGQPVEVETTVNVVFSLSR